MNARVLITILAITLLTACDCGSSHTSADATVADAGPPRDAPASDAPGRDAGPDGGDAGPTPDAGTGTLRVIGSFGTISGPVAAGRFRLVDHGFQRGARSCAGSLCVTGAFVR